MVACATITKQVGGSVCQGRTQAVVVARLPELSRHTTPSCDSITTIQALQTVHAVFSVPCTGFIQQAGQMITLEVIEIPYEITMATKSSGTTVHKIARLSRFLGNGQWKPKKKGNREDHNPGRSHVQSDVGKWCVWGFESFIRVGLFEQSWYQIFTQCRGFGRNCMKSTGD